MNVKDVPLAGVTVPDDTKELPTLGVNVPPGASPLSDSPTPSEPLKPVPVSVTVQVPDAALSSPVPEAHVKAMVDPLLVYPSDDALLPVIPAPVNDNVIVPTAAGVYVKENEVLPLPGVTVTDDLPAEPTLGVIVPPIEPSAIVML